jgi:hypothetical protein
MKFIEARPNETRVRRVKAEDTHNVRHIGRCGLILSHHYYNIINKNFTVMYDAVRGTPEERDACCDPDEFEPSN